MGRRGAGAPELSDEEQKTVEKEFQAFQGYAVPKQVGDQFRRLVTARGLARYASRQVVIGGAGSRGTRQREPMERAIAALSKAYGACGLPVYLYDMATLMEMVGRADAARELFEVFLEQQASFVPDQMEAAFLGERDLEEAARDARDRIGMGAQEQRARSSATADERTTCGRCGSGVEPWARVCPTCGWNRSGGWGTAVGAPPPDLAEDLPRRAADGSPRFLVGIVSLVAVGVLLALVVIGLASYGVRPQGEQVAAPSRQGGDAAKLRISRPSQEDLAPLLDAEKAHAAILDGAAVLHTSLARDDANDSDYRTVVQVALDGMARAVEAQRAAEDSGRLPSRGKAYQAWLDCVAAEIDAYVERFNRGEVGSSRAAREEALAPLDAAIAGYDAAYRGAGQLPSPGAAQATTPYGEAGGQDQGAGASEGADQGELAHPSDQTDIPESYTGPDAGESAPIPEAGPETPSPDSVQQ